MKHGKIRDYEWAAAVCRRRSQRALNCVAGWLWAAAAMGGLMLLTVALDARECYALVAAALALCLLMMAAYLCKHWRAQRELREVLS